MQPKLPEQRHTPKGTRAWCVYCGRIMEFAWDDYLGTARCGSCEISVYDFYVRTTNGLWRDGAMSRFQHTVQGEGKRQSRNVKCWRTTMNRKCKETGDVAFVS